MWRIRIKKASAGKDFSPAVLKVIAELVKETKDIRFEGNNYSEDWVKEAKKRGLPNVASTVDALKALEKKENIALFEKYKVFSKEELLARHKIWVDLYNLTLEIEANTLNEMVNSCVVPSGCEYERLLADNLSRLVSLKKEVKLELEDAVLNDQKEHLSEVAQMIYYVRRNSKELVKLLEESAQFHHEEKAKLYFKELKPLMEHIRRHVDALERVVSDEHWDLPKYREMLFIK